MASACVQPPAGQGNRVVSVPLDNPDDERSKPAGWKTTMVNIGQSFNSLASLHFIQSLQVPRPTIPYITSMTFYAPRELPIVMIGLYYERSADSAPTRGLLTSSAFGLQRIGDPDVPLRFAPDQVESVQPSKFSPDQLNWFTENRQRMVDAMRGCAQGATLSKKFDCDFTSRPRPPASMPAALVVSDGSKSGSVTPYTFIAQQLVFTE
jgi:hypothetical protein